MSSNTSSSAIDTQLSMPTVKCHMHAERSDMVSVFHKTRKTFDSFYSFLSEKRSFVIFVALAPSVNANYAYCIMSCWQINMPNVYTKQEKPFKIFFNHLFQ